MRILLCLFSLLLLLSSCSSVKEIPVKGRLHDYPILTTVDDERAKYYLENYLANQREESELDREIDLIHKTFEGRLPTREELKKVSDKMSVDFAALVFGNQLLKQKANSQLQIRFLLNLKNVKNKTVKFSNKDILVMIVPGYDYVENGHFTGADFAKPRKSLKRAGYDVHFVAIDPIGSVEENAAVITQSILKNKDRQMAIVGASSAGPAIHLSLGKLVKANDLKNVKAWLNLGGILQGVPVLDKFSSGIKGMLFSLIVWFKDWRMDSFESMYTGISRKRFATLKVPDHIFVINYLGLSLSGDISDFSRDKYLMMRDDGPNDGLTLLPDVIAPDSLSILAPKSYHFFAEDPEIDSKTWALLVTVMEQFR